MTRVIVKKITEFEVVSLEEVLRQIRLPERVSPSDELTVLPCTSNTASERKTLSHTQKIHMRKRSHG